jgi:hypothetical protein
MEISMLLLPVLNWKEFNVNESFFLSKLLFFVQ